MKNWAGNITYSTDRILAPQSLEELQEAVREAKHVRFLGSKHSFNTLADSDDTIISLHHFTAIQEPIDGTVTMGGGVTYGQLASFLQPRGWAVHNLASLPHISIVGACATATHGSGRKSGNLATAVVSFKSVIADGSIRTFSGDEINAAAVHLGLLGAIFEVTLRVEPSFEVRQWVYQNMPLDQALANFDALSSAGDSVSLFTHWSGDIISQVWVKDRGPFAAPPELFGAKRATQKLHPLTEMDPINCTEQLGESGPWCDRLPHFKMEFTPSAGEELQSEFFVPFAKAQDAIRALNAMGDQISPLVYVSEIRFIASDELYMSPAYGEDVIGIHFTWRPLWSQVQEVLPIIEDTLRPFDARPHWGKLHTMSSEDVQRAYPRLGRLVKLARDIDPNGKFVNAFLAPLCD
ncbi:MAG TPA: D-arabinono-1,4-lactone oxidase [Fimbriimonas sp.]|nr:D-arabinono-1,4-lactone oxidase [Fimbriimonas sp.]